MSQPLDRSTENQLSYRMAFFMLSQMGGILTVRSYIMAVQLFLKRFILAQNNAELLAGFGGLAAVEEVIFAFCYGCKAITSPIISATKVCTELTTDHPEYLDSTALGVKFRQAILLDLALIIPVGIVCFSAPAFYRLTKQPEIVVNQSADYFYYAFFAYFFDFSYRIGARLMIGLEKPTSLFFADLMEGVLDVLFTYALVNGEWGFPKMGLPGSSLGFAIAAAITSITHYGYLYFHAELKKYELFRIQNGFSLATFPALLFQSFSLGITDCVGSISQSIITIYCGLFGPAALSAMQIAAVYSFWLTLPVGAFSESACVFVANSWKKKSSDYRIFGNTNLLCAGIYSTFCFLLLLAFHKELMKLFIQPNGKDDGNFELTAQFLLMQGALEILNSVKCTGSYVLAGCFDAHIPSVIGVGTIVVLNTALATLALFAFHARAATMFGMQFIGYLLAASLMMERWHFLDKPEESPVLQLASYAKSSACRFWRKPPQTQIPPDLTEIVSVAAK
jgi:MATE family multidrug resistance protein